jgi:hypothetical protein
MKHNKHAEGKAMLSKCPPSPPNILHFGAGDWTQPGICYAHIHTLRYTPTHESLAYDKVLSPNKVVRSLSYADLNLGDQDKQPGKLGMS